MNSTRLSCTAILICLVAVPLQSAPGIGHSGTAAEPQEKFREELAAKLRTAENEGAGAITGADGFLFLSSDIRFLSVGQFWGDQAGKVSRAHKPESADPIPAIVDFQQQLKQRGIDLLVVPVPPKAEIYPEKIAADVDLHGESPAPFLTSFLGELRNRGIDIVDLTGVFNQNRTNERGPVFCKTDTHWSGFGCVLAAQMIADKIRTKFDGQAHRNYTAEWKEIEIKGDVVDLLGSKTKKMPEEKLPVRMITEKDSGAAVTPDPNSPLLVLGDSHTLVYHEFHAEKSGLIDQLANELGFAPDLIGTRGSGATAVRISLYRHARKNPDYLSKKKVIVWCFAAREFTESDQGWEKVPVGQ